MNSVDPVCWIPGAETQEPQPVPPFSPTASLGSALWGCVGSVSIQPLWPVAHGSVSLCPQGLIQGVDELLATPGDLEALPHSEKRCVATNLLLGLENVLRGLSEALPSGFNLTINASAGTGKCPGLSPGPALAVPSSFLPSLTGAQ